jgi:hypothetical protein
MQQPGEQGKSPQDKTQQDTTTQQDNKTTRPRDYREGDKR